MWLLSLEAGSCCTRFSTFAPAPPVSASGISTEAGCLLTLYHGTGLMVAGMAVLTMGRLAAAANVNIETVRYYERRGLLPRRPRSRWNSR